jgi:hypothetical protein
LKFFRGFLHPTLETGSVRQSPKSEIDSFYCFVSIKEILLSCIVKESGGTFRKLGPVIFEQSIYSIYKRSQLFVVIPFPVLREKMVVENICDDRGIFMEKRAKSYFRLEDDRVGIGVVINFSMEKNSPLNGVWIVEKTVSTNSIPDKVPNNKVRIVSGKV